MKEPTPDQERLAPPEIIQGITNDVVDHGAGIEAVEETTTEVAAHHVAGMANHAVTNIVIIVNINTKVNIDHLHLLKILNDHHFECRYTVVLNFVQAILSCILLTKDCSVPQS